MPLDNPIKEFSMSYVTRILAFALSLPVALLVASPELRAQAPAESHTGQKTQMGAGAQTMEDCQTMMAEREKMMTEMRSAEAKLDELIAEMNSAQGDAKVEALASVVTEMNEQHEKTMGQMMAMQPRMLQHMMQHMQGGMMEGNEQAMECPMMKEMMGPTKK
jgi:hypothetical protein